MFHFILSLLPLVLLIFLMGKRSPYPSWIALLISGGLTYGVRLFFFDSSPRLLHAGIIQGFLSAWTPILIIAGALFLFQTLENSFALHTIKTWLNGISSNTVAQLMIIGWAFIFFIEGVSGFGTPIALAAPLLVGLGYKPIQTLIFCLLMDTIPVSFGAIGAPTWFGFSHLNLDAATLLHIGQHSALLQSVMALIIPIWALKVLVSWRVIRQNSLFIFLSLASCIVPYMLFAQISTEFPSIIGGAIGLVVTVCLALGGVGLQPTKKKKNISAIPLSQRVKAFFPLWGTVLVLLLTRLDFFQIKPLLNATSPAFTIGNFSISSGGVLQLQNIIGTDISWKHAVLYVPSIIPFFLVSVISFWVLGMERFHIRRVFQTSFSRLKKPILTLIFALILVKLFWVGTQAPALILGSTMAEVLGNVWIIFAPFLGALGAFFSGSNTIANLTFGGVQLSAAQNLGVSPVPFLALQNIGGAAGNMISISNIIAGGSVLGLVNKEGIILKKTILPLLVYCGVAGLLGLLL